MAVLGVVQALAEMGYEDILFEYVLNITRPHTGAMSSFSNSLFICATVAYVFM